MWIVVSTALAQAPFAVEAFPVLDETADPLVANGLGAPTVVWVPEQQRYLMFFETRTGAATPGDCPAGEWAVGLASSDDGLAWDVWPTPIVAPGVAGTPYRCVAAHPTALYEDGVVHLWFKAEQGVVTAGCGYGWGCANYTGVGYATVVADVDDKTDEIALVEADIDDVEQARLAALADFHALAAQYQSDLVGNQAEFACVDDLPVCAPCGTSGVLSASDGAPTSESFCQPFSFAVPATLPVTGPNVWSHFGFLEYRTGAGAIASCMYVPNLFSPTSPYPLLGCTGVGVGAGSVVSGDWVRLSMTHLLGNPHPTELTTTLTALPGQTLRGSLVTSLADALAGAGAGDGVATEAALPGLIADLQTLESWLDDDPADPERASLAAQSLALVAAAQDLLALLDATRIDLAALGEELAALQAYVPDVQVTVFPDVALAVSQTFGFPNVAKVDGEYIMLLQDYPDLMQATGVDPTAFTLDPVPVMSAGQAVWAQDEVFEPAMACAGDIFMPLQVWVGGRRTVGGAVVEAGISDGVSDGVSWFMNVIAGYVPQSLLSPLPGVGYTWTDPNLYRHFDVLRSDDGDTRVWYSQKDPVSGIVRIGVMSDAGGTWDHDATTNRVCE